ncbi:MAG TPA: DUF6541 family protein [Solirubrobacterales bacterium]|nr:DUF6541 family protein [Solirubrobacterales bacterium]
MQTRLESPPAIALLAAIGLLLCSLANAFSRETLDPSQLVYWLGILLIAVPIFLRLTSTEPSSRERLGLVLLLGLALYGVKIVHDAPLFTLSDEYIHAFNVDQIEKFDHLYHFNPAIPTSPYYPGLEGATSALTMLTGASTYVCGTILIGAARLVQMAALFFLFARLSGSARGAGIGVAVYTGTSNFLFWGAQFSYESLSLPLVCVVLMAFVEREEAPASDRRAWAVPMVLGILAITITHHLSSYALAVILVALAVLYRVMKVEKPNPWPFAALAVGSAVAWLLIAAQSTTGYLFPVLENAVKAIFKTAFGDTEARQLFGSPSDTAEAVAGTPLGARAIALLAIAVLGVVALIGLRQVWRRERRKPLVIVFCAFTFAFFAALMLRFAPAAWETGNRAGGYFFIGLSFVAIYGIAELLRRGSRPMRRRLLITAALAVVLVGGAISGWSWDLQLARPIKASAAGAEISSEPLALAEFAAERLDGSRFAAPEADARVLLTPGGQVAFGGQGPDIEDIVDEPQLHDWQLPLLESNHLPFLVADRRQLSEDTLRGQYFSVKDQYGNELRPKGVVHKFSEIPVGRVWHSGRIVLFNLRDRP